jgi:hypothetical protein
MSKAAITAITNGESFSEHRAYCETDKIYVPGSRWTPDENEAKKQKSDHRQANPGHRVVIFTRQYS